MALALPTSLTLAQAPETGASARPHSGSNLSLAPDVSGQESLPIQVSHAPPAAEDRDQRSISSNPAESKTRSATERPTGSTIRSLTDQFQADRESLLKKRELERKAFAEKLLTAVGEERDRLIAEFREKQRAWLQEQLARNQEEFRQRLKSLRDEFKNRERDQLLEEVKGKTDELRDRLGKD